MQCNTNNCCAGRYGKCLDVKIIDDCNGKCAFCIERGANRTVPAKVGDMIISTNIMLQSGYENVLILGGEPFLYSHLVEYIYGIKAPNIFITTNGSTIDMAIFAKIAQKLSGINFSIHHYDEVTNQRIVGTRIGFNNIKNAITLLKIMNPKINVRINCNLVVGGIDSSEAAVKMIEQAINFGANEIRFAELQLPEKMNKLFVDAKNIFAGANLPDQPFIFGCEHVIEDTVGIKVLVRQVCGIVNPIKPEVIKPKGRKSATKVLYPDAKVNEGWRDVKGVDHSSGCHNMGGSGGCHARG